MRHVFATVMVTVLPAGGAHGQQASSPPDSCAGLAQLALPEAKVVSAEGVPAGAFTPPPSLNPWTAGDPAFYKALPAFCRVVVKATPSADSDIPIEVWMPAGGWNGRFRGQGNGGFAGEIDYRSMGAAVARGDATAGTNTGHSAGGTDASWALGHPEKVTDFGYRAIHAMTQIAKATIKAHCGSPARHSYFGSCSNGGRQALMEAQRFPDDYDGILAGAPANYWTHLLTKAVADSQATTLEPASYIPSAKLPAIARAVNAACDARDGVTDGVLNDPRQCRFDPATLACRDGDSDACLTAPQVTALKKLYGGPRDARGREIFPGYVPGAEEGEGGWGPWITGPAPGKSLLFAFGTGYFANVVYEKAGWDYRNANLDEALKAAEEKTAAEARRERREPRGVRGTRREADPLPRLERPRDLGVEHDPLLRQRGEPPGTAGDRRVRAALHGSGDAALRWRARSELVRAVLAGTVGRASAQRDDRARKMGGGGRGPVHGRRHQVRRRRSEEGREGDASALPLPADRDVQGPGRPQRRRQLRLHGSEVRAEGPRADHP